MGEYLEGNDNIFVHIFYEFLTFLYLIQYDCKTNKMLHNIMLDSKKIRIRALCDFFSEERKKKGDMIYTDFIISDMDLCVALPTNLRTFINKETAHITEMRGKLDVPNDELIETIKSIVSSINSFIGELDRNIKSEYKQCYQDNEMQKIRQNTLTAILKLVIYNDNNGVVFKL